VISAAQSIRNGRLRAVRFVLRAEKGACRNFIESEVIQNE
jgi:hypothetical protein